MASQRHALYRAHGRGWPEPWPGAVACWQGPGLGSRAPLEPALTACGETRQDPHPIQTGWAFLSLAEVCSFSDLYFIGKESLSKGFTARELKNVIPQLTGNNGASGFTICVNPILLYALEQWLAGDRFEAKQFGDSFITGVCFKEYPEEDGTRWSGRSGSMAG